YGPRCVSTQAHGAGRDPWPRGIEPGYRKLVGQPGQVRPAGRETTEGHPELRTAQAPHDAVDIGLPERCDGAQILATELDRDLDRIDADLLRERRCRPGADGLH